MSDSHGTRFFIITDNTMWFNFVGQHSCLLNVAQPYRVSLSCAKFNSVAARRSVFGFTLVELLVALALLVTMSAATAVIFRGIIRAWRTGELRTERYQQARLLFDLFGRELVSMVFDPRYPVVGTDVVEPPLHAASARDELMFVGALPGRAGLVERGYWVNEVGMLFCHDEEPADGDYATGQSERCGSDVSGFELSYFDGTAWLTSWDARVGAPQERRVPTAIRIALSLGVGRHDLFETIIHIPTSD